MNKEWAEAPSLGNLIKRYNKGERLTNWERARVHGHQRVKGNAERHARGVGDKPLPLVAKLTKKVAEDSSTPCCECNENL